MSDNPMPPVEYAEDKGRHCPFCRGTDFRGGSIEVAAGTATQEVTCHDCDKSWIDQYALTGYLEDE